jgi:hypothetical protein
MNFHSGRPSSGWTIRRTRRSIGGTVFAKRLSEGTGGKWK